MRKPLVVSVLLACALATLLVSCRQPKNEGRVGASAANEAYEKPPANTVESSLSELQDAFNTRDSARYWSLHLWENRDWVQLTQPTRKVWDSTLGSNLKLDLLSIDTFHKHVHTEGEHALFAHAKIVFSMSSAKTMRDTMIALLRVDSGKWRFGYLSLDDPNKPFYKTYPKVG